jgi:hypothetical protein
MVIMVQLELMEVQQEEMPEMVIYYYYFIKYWLSIFLFLNNIIIIF